MVKRTDEISTRLGQGKTHMTLGGDTDNSNFSRLMFSIKIPVLVMDEQESIRNQKTDVK